MLDYLADVPERLGTGSISSCNNSTVEADRLFPAEADVQAELQTTLQDYGENVHGRGFERERFDLVLDDEQGIVLGVGLDWGLASIEV